MSVSAGGLDPLLGAVVPAGDLYSLHITSYTTSGSGTDERIASLTATVGTPDFFQGFTIAPTFTSTISAIDDTLNTATFTAGIGIANNPGAFAPSYALGYTPTAIILSTLPSFNIALGLDLALNQDISLAIFSEQPLTEGSSITFPASGT